MEVDVIKLHCIHYETLINKKTLSLKKCHYIHLYRKLEDTDRITGETENTGDGVACPYLERWISEQCPNALVLICPLPWVFCE